VSRPEEEEKGMEGEEEEEVLEAAVDL